MRFQHSSRTVRFLGQLGIACGFIGLVSQGSTYLKAQDALPAPEMPAEQAAPITLGEVLSSKVPAAFSQTVLKELLPDSWKSWYLEVNGLFIELYEKSPSAEDVDRILGRLKVKRETLSNALQDSSYSMIHSRLRELRSQMDRNVALIQAVQGALADQDKPLSSGLVDTAYSRLASAASNARTDLQHVNTGEQWLSYFRIDELAAIARNKKPTPADLDVLTVATEHLTNLKLYSPEQAAFVKRSSLARLGQAASELAGLVSEQQSPRDLKLERLRAIVAAVNDYEANGTAGSAAQLRADLINPTTLHVANALASVIQRNYLSDNFRASVSESLIRRLLSDSRVERGIVNDCVFGARVVGDQWTATDLSVDLVQSLNSARFLLSLNGTVTTNTRGITPKATVFTKGNHRFTASKSVSFDGYRFASAASSVGVNANNHTYNAAARTKIPIIRGIIRNIAMDRARELKPRSDAMAERKIRDQVGSRFDSEVLEMFGKAEGRLDNELYSRLRDVGLYPERQAVSSTDTTLDLAARVMEPTELAASPPPSIPYVSNGLAGQVHESYLNNALDRMNIAGQKMTSEDLKQEFKRFAEAALGRPVNMEGRSQVIEQTAASDDDLTDAKFIFDSEDPIRVRIAADRIYLTIKAGLETSKETIPTQIIEIPFDVTLEGTDVVLKRGTIGVRPVQPARNRVRQIAQANVMRNKIAETLPERRINGTFDIALEEKTIPMAVRSLDLTDGWMTVRAE